MGAEVGADRAEGLVIAQIIDGVAVLRLTHPPVNTLAVRMRRALSDALDDILPMEQVRAIVLAGNGKSFSAGTDLADLEHSAELAGLCARIEHSAKPVVAALEGPALAGGADVALAAHYRVATRSARLGFTDIALGLLPAGGGCQRLTRIVGPRIAVQMITGGRAVDEMVARRIGLFDRLVNQDARSAACTLARELAAAGRVRPVGKNRTHLDDGRAFMAEIQAARGRRYRMFAKSRAVDCVEVAALLPYAEALSFEAQAREDCLAHPQSRALRHLAIAERNLSDVLVMDPKNPQSEIRPKGQAVVARIYAAQDRAIVRLVSDGATEAEVDSAMLDLGFSVGPFGGKTGAQVPRIKTLQRRIIAACAAEGARCLEQDMVARAADIDALAARAMAWPRTNGGPMIAASQLGLLALQREMAAWSRQDAVWAVPESWKQAALQSKGFALI